MAKRITLVGIGMGDVGSLTIEAQTLLRRAELVIGAKRLLESVCDISAKKLALVRTTEIIDACCSCSEKVICIIYSGDTGFFSGSSTFLSVLADRLACASTHDLLSHNTHLTLPDGESFSLHIVPGVSCLQYFCSKTGESWDDARIVSVHGRRCDYVFEVRSHKKVFLLTGGTERVQDICAHLDQAGLGYVRVVVGERLSYGDEVIEEGTASELSCNTYSDLAVMMVYNDAVQLSQCSSHDKAPLVYDRQMPYSGEESTSAPRLLISAASSNSGKTTLVCGLLEAFVQRGLKPLACKCGPDYIDPMFHTKVIGAKSRNLDLFLSDKELVTHTLAQESALCDITLIEGAMGYYDGIAMGSDASAWDVAQATATPALLVVDGRGRALSIAAEVRGFMSLRNPSYIAGVIVNRVSAALYPRLQKAIREECGIPVLGYVPPLEDFTLESRHLGLVTANEVKDLHEKVASLAATLESTVDIEGLMALAKGAAPLVYRKPAISSLVSCEKKAPRIAIASDDAFCFYYEDTLRLFTQLGAEIVTFSPLEDSVLPADVSGLYLGGGYPELYAYQLEANESMRQSVKAAIADGMPTIAECGGFLYLHASLEDDKGQPHSMVGVLPHRAFKTEKLGRFGYIAITAKQDCLLANAGESLKAHEFHYWESEDPGACFQAKKPQSTRSWECCISNTTLHAGFPHLYLPGNVDAAKKFVCACAAYAEERNNVRDN